MKFLPKDLFTKFRPKNLFTKFRPKDIWFTKLRIQNWQRIFVDIWNLYFKPHELF